MDELSSLKEQVLQLQRRLRQDNVIVHGMEKMDADTAAAKVLDLLGLSIGYVEAYWLGRKPYRVPLLIRLKRSSDQRLVRETARRVRPPGVFVNADLCPEDRDALKRKRQQRVPDREVEQTTAQPPAVSPEQEKEKADGPTEPATVRARRLQSSLFLGNREYGAKHRFRRTADCPGGRESLEKGFPEVQIQRSAELNLVVAF